MDVQRTYSVPALERAITILELFVDSEELTIKDIHETLELPKSSTYVILSTLERADFLVRTKDGKYRLGHRLFSLGMMYYHRLDIRREARAYLESLVEDTPYTAHLAILIDGKAVYIDKVEGGGFVRFATTVGQALPLYASAVGKALVIRMSDDEINDIVGTDFKKYTDHTPSNIDDVLAEIEFARTHGYSFEDEQMESGIRCIGAPIYDSNGDVVAAISLTALTRDLPAINFETVGNRVQAAALGVSKRLGFEISLLS